MKNIMEPTFEAKRGESFWIAGILALFLSIVSYFNPTIVARLNGLLLPMTHRDDVGWWVYLGLRLPFVVLLVVTIFRFPVQTNVAGERVKRAKQRKSFDPLLGLRALACLLVLMGHYFIAAVHVSPEDAWYIRRLLTTSPWSGVWIFFTLSGYLMGKGFIRGRYTLDETGSRLFFRNRLFRIMPVYLSGILIVSIYRYPQIFEMRHWWILLEMFLFDYRGDLPINPIGALWSVSTEVQFYLVVPLFLVLLLRLRERLHTVFVLVPFALVCLGTAVRIALTHIAGLNFNAYVYAPLLTNLDLFLAGMSINLIPSIDLPRFLRNRLGLILLIMGVGFYIAIGAATLNPDSFYLGNYFAKCPLVCCVFAMCFIYLAEQRGSIAMEKGWGGGCLVGLQTIGMLTYCLYVFHPEILLVNVGLLPHGSSLSERLLIFPKFMFEVVAVASFFYFAVEKPFDARKRVSGTAVEDAP